MKNLIKNKNKYLILGIFAFVLFFISTAPAFGQSTPVITITATPAVVNSGSTSVITWNTTNASGISSVGCFFQTGAGAPGSTGPTGSFTTPPLTTASALTYTIVCYSGGSSITGSAVVTIAGAPVIAVSASPATINPGDSSTITWQATGADFCTSPQLGAPNTQAITTSGFAIVTPKTTTIYYINCTHQGITATRIVYVIVNQPSNPGAGSITDVLTKEVTGVTDTSVIFSGEMNPGGDGSVGSANAYFRYSTVAPEGVTPVFCNDIFGSNMRATNEVPIWGNTIKKISISAGDLEPNTTYYYCIVGSNDNQIAYGKNVLSFTTDISPSDDPNAQKNNISVTTETATVIDGKSAYLNGFYNTEVPAHTWFQYRKKSPAPQGATTGGASGFLNNLYNFFQTKEALAATTGATKNVYVWSGKIGEKGHNKNTNGDISFLLNGLSASTIYEFRAVIGSDTSAKISYGNIFSFKTKSSSRIGPGNGIGTKYINPCMSTDDVNCNGTGGGSGTGTGLLTLPDLIARAVTFSTSAVNTPVTLSSIITNQGTASTAGTSSVKNIGGGAITSFLDNFFKTNKAEAAAATNSNFPKGSFYNFFQISMVNPNSANDLNSSTLVNFPPIAMSPLGPKSSRTITQSVTFPSIGTYYTRACADKSSPSDPGLITESYENNNCSPWTNIIIGNPSLTCTDSSATNYGGSLPCQTNIGPSTVCTDTSATNYGDTLPCTWTGNTGGTGFCADPSATNYGGSLPCVGGSGTGNGGGTGNDNGTNNPVNLVLGQTATPPVDAVVHYHEGIETVFQRQIVANTDLAKAYGYQTGADLQTFAWDLADLLAKSFGYVNKSGEEIRVGPPDMAAYQLYLDNGILTVYEYYNSKIVNIQKMTGALRNKYGYEYYFHK